MSELYAFGVFRIPVKRISEVPEAWEEFREKFKDRKGFEEHVFIAKPDENREVALLNAVVDILAEIEELEGAVEAESQFVEAVLEGDWDE